MRKFNFIFAVFAFIGLGFSAPAYDFTPYWNEDTAVVIHPGTLPADYGIVVKGMYQPIYAEGTNGGIGILGQDAYGVRATGQHQFPAVFAEGFGFNEAIGVSASAVSEGNNSYGVSAWASSEGDSAFGVLGSATADIKPVGVYGKVTNGQAPSGVFATATTNNSYSWPTAVSAVARTGNNPMSTSGIRVAAIGANRISPNDNAYGIWATGTGAGGLNYGIYAEGTTYAGRFQGNGLFSGNVTVTGTCACYPSDEKLKKNVKPLNKGLDVVMALEPKAYDMKVDEFKGKLALAEGPQVGMIAQEVEKLMPELITKVNIPGHESIDEDGKVTKTEDVDYKSLNYVGLIPVLVKAIQEQEAKIEALERKLATR